MTDDQIDEILQTVWKREKQMNDFTVQKITVSKLINDEWHEAFTCETPLPEQTLIDIVSVFIGLGTKRERKLEDMLKKKTSRKTALAKKKEKSNG
jgi:hypothetical protein